MGCHLVLALLRALLGQGSHLICTSSNVKIRSREATQWSSKSRKLHLPPSLPTFHILLVLLVPRKPILFYWPKGKQAQSQQKEKKARIILIG